MLVSERLKDAKLETVWGENEKIFGRYGLPEAIHLSSKRSDYGGGGCCYPCLPQVAIAFLD